MDRNRLFKIGMLIALLLVAAGVVGSQPALARNGTPVFHVDSWSFQPPELERGKEFDLTLTFTNVGTYGANEVLVSVGQSAHFVGLVPSLRIPHMGIGESRTVAIRGAVSNTITTGYYAVPVDITYHHTALGGSRMSDQQDFGVYVRGLPPDTGVVAGRPQLIIEGAKVAVSNIDNHLLLTLMLRNTGNNWATNVIVNMTQSQYFSPVEGSSAFPYDDVIRIDETVSVTLPLILIESPGRRVVQDFTLEYASTSGAGPFQSQQSVPIELGDIAGQAPRLLIERYATTPETISPGSAFRLDFELVNLGAGPARQIFMRLGESADTLGPLAPAGSSNVRYLESVDGNMRVTISYDLVVDGDAEAGVVPIDVNLEYQDDFGVVHKETETISLLVTATPHLRIGFFEPLPEMIFTGERFELPIEVINIGRTMVNVSTVEVTSDTLLISDGSLYVGPLDGGTAGTLVPQAEAQEPGTATITVTINYLDNFQQPQTVVQTMTIEIQDSGLSILGADDANADATTPDTDGGVTAGQRLWRAILGFLGLGTRPVSEVSGEGGSGRGGRIIIQTPEPANTGGDD